MIEKLISYSDNPSLYEVTAAMELLCPMKVWISFRYTPLPECKKKLTPSKAAAMASTIMPKNPWDWRKVSGFLNDGAFWYTKHPSYGPDGLNIVRPMLTLRNQKRKNAGDVVDTVTGEIVEPSYFSDKSNAQEDGTTKEGFDKGEYLYRSYRLDVRNDGYGLDLSTVEIAQIGKTKQRLFPNARPNMRAEDVEKIMLEVQARQLDEGKF